MLNLNSQSTEPISSTELLVGLLSRERSYLIYPFATPRRNKTMENDFQPEGNAH